ncbi:arylsulfatase [Kribbella sindirgiensis]|uniref:Arylsulfatase n=1 Tax=Kribbella sindirgiensis TaxID=1124744 RepID=A0A4R0IHP6_9ACTN|nr:arylsulfatase [Kribbella sindirgiensis]TCC32139.1 arylsulfatase [Kribbella sindirgiensis]
MTTVRPNVLIILVDDMGYSDIGCFGGEIGTPNIDGLAGNGVRLTNFYNTARCSPSRASLLTGLHPHQTGVAELVNNDGPGGYPGSLTEHCTTLSETFRAAGYHTHMTGKWHLSNERERPDRSWPTRRGFERFWGTISGAGSYFQTTTLHDGETPVPVDDLGPDFYYTDEIGTHAASAIRDAADDERPFFGYVAFTAPHWPLHAKDSDLAETRGLFDEGWDVLRTRRRQRQLDAGICAADATLDRRDPDVPAWDDEPEQKWQLERMEAYAAQVRAMDRAVGTILTALDDTAQRENTIVLFLSDNGGCAEELRSDPEGADRFRRHHLIIPPSAPDGTPMRVGNSPEIRPGTADTYTSYGQAWANLSNTPFRLYKRWVHEGGIATPLIVSWPAGDLTGGVIDAPHQLTDIAPTLLEATGVPAPTERSGRRVPALPGVSMLELLHGGSAVEHDLFWEHIGNAAIRSGRWKLVREFGGPWELYDLAVDRSESNDQAADHPERVADLAARWQSWADEVGVIPYGDVLAARATMPVQPA